MKLLETHSYKRVEETTGISKSTLISNPGATGTIEVDYNSGPNTAAALYPQTADVNGTINWTWKVGTSTAPCK